jgi:DNA replication and repair protein RecF
LHLSSLHLTNFRNFKKKSFEFSSELNFIIGENGIGKTNVLEAVYLLGNGVSLKKSHLKWLTHVGETIASVEGHFVDEAGSSHIQIDIQDGKRSVQRDGSSVRLLRDFLGSFLVLGFSPDNLGLIKGGASARRNLIDKLAVDLNPALVSHYGAFAKALLHKRTLLKSGTTLSHLEPWNKLIAKSSSYILQQRYLAVRQLNNAVPLIYQKLFGLNLNLSLDYFSTCGTSLEEGELHSVLQSCGGRELRAKRPLIGPHLDDLNLLLDGKPLKEMASQGQIRSVAVAVLLANAEILEDSLNRSPVLVLDDVDSELDEHRRNVLFALVGEKKRQVFISSTDTRFINDSRFTSANFVCIT